ncbi:type III-B CRISPR module RAMP protein Cmr1 [Pelagibius sp. CAU 1746]|uniref:type III-B CRISPR module RAMP protein Cmr1 n=1 Tax=Pelagibius sp. CAU 1746 TaxID=3140370 RepID=UPI00325BD9D0
MGFVERSIEATFEVVTPMFLGDAEQGASRIRESSIKGALAFWWRALHFPEFLADVEPGTHQRRSAFAALRDREQHLFGGPERQGLFLLRVISQPKSKSAGESVRDRPGAVYLGYGCINVKGADLPKIGRDYFEAGTLFTLQLLFRPTANEEDLAEIVQVLRAFGLIGGLGSRVRRGYGSVALVSLKTKGLTADLGFETRPETRQAYIDDLTALVRSQRSLDVQGSALDVTCFARETECRILETKGQGPFDALDEIGQSLQLYRLWGRDGKINGKPREENFRADHDWFKAGTGRGNRDYAGVAEERLPERAAFGLPHNYYSRDGGPKGKGFSITVGAGHESTADRRASPLFIHIHKLTAGKHLVCLLHFPTRFLPPKNEQTTVSLIKVVRQTKDYVYDAAVVSRFLERFPGSEVDLLGRGKP